MDRCTDCHDITEILLKTALNTIKSVNQQNPTLKTNSEDKTRQIDIQYFLLFFVLFSMLPKAALRNYLLLNQDNCHHYTFSLCYLLKQAADTKLIVCPIPESVSKTFSKKKKGENSS